MPSYLLGVLSDCIDRVFRSGEPTVSRRNVPARTTFDDSPSCGTVQKKVSNPNETAKLVIEEIDRDCWWNGKASADTGNIPPIHDKINSDEIIAAINEKLDKNEMPVIDIPDNILKVMELLNNHDFDYSQVVSLINRSPAMAGEFIKIVNSSIYSRGVPVTDLKIALPRMGKSNIKAFLYVYSSKLGFTKDRIFNSLAESIVSHSYATGIVASFLSQRFYPDPDSAFFAGLLHDIGKLGIIKAIADNKIIPQSLLRKAVINDQTFEPIFCNLHERAGTFLASHWHLDKDVIAAIEHHHDFVDAPFDEDEQVGRSLACLISLSDMIARILGYGRGLTHDVNIFLEPAIIDLSIERTPENYVFFNDIPKVLNFKIEQQNEASASRVKP